MKGMGISIAIITIIAVEACMAMILPLLKPLDQYLNQEWDYVITVCGGAQETCPVFTGKVGKRLHIGFDDPDVFKGTEGEVLPEFRRVRDEILK